MFQQQQSQPNSAPTPHNPQNHHAASPSHHYLHPSTLTQLSFQQPIQNSAIEQSKIKQGKNQWRSWTDDQHLKLSVLFRDRGPSWEQIYPQFEKRYKVAQKRQSGQIKRHFFCSLKKVYRQLNEAAKNQPATPTRSKTLQFKDLKRLIEEIRKHKSKPEEIYSRSQNLISRLLSTQRPQAPHHNNYSQQDLQELQQTLVRVKTILSKKQSQASTAIIQKQEVQIQHNRIEKGYQSDSSSVFGQEDPSEQRKELPSIEQYREDEAFNANSHNQLVEERRQRVVVQDDEERIRQLLLREGLLEFQPEEGEADVNFVGNEAQLVENDVLDNQSYQNFCTNEFIETKKANFKEKSGGARPFVEKTNHTDTTTK